MTGAWVGTGAALRIRNADPDPACHFYADPDPAWHFDAQNLEEVLKQAHNPYIMACHLQIDADPDPDQAYPFDAYQDLQHWGGEIC